MTAPSPGRFAARLRSAARDAPVCRSRPWFDPSSLRRPRQRRRTLICVRITAETKRNIVFITSEVTPLLVPTPTVQPPECSQHIATNCLCLALTAAPHVAVFMLSVRHVHGLRREAVFG